MPFLCHLNYCHSKKSSSDIITLQPYLLPQKTPVIMTLLCHLAYDIALLPYLLPCYNLVTIPSSLCHFTATVKRCYNGITTLSLRVYHYLTTILIATVKPCYNLINILPQSLFATEKSYYNAAILCQLWYMYHHYLDTLLTTRENPCYRSIITIPLHCHKKYYLNLPCDL